MTGKCYGRIIRGDQKLYLYEKEKRIRRLRYKYIDKNTIYISMNKELFNYVFETEESKQYLLERVFVSKSPFRLIYPILMGLILLGLSFSIGLRFLEGLSLIIHDSSLFIKSTLYSIPLILISLFYLYYIIRNYHNTPYKKGIRKYCGNKTIKKRFKSYIKGKTEEVSYKARKIKKTSGLKAVFPRSFLYIIPFLLFIILPIGLFGKNGVLDYLFLDTFNHYVYGVDDVGNAHYIYSHKEPVIAEEDEEEPLYYLETHKENGVSYHFLMSNGEVVSKIIEDYENRYRWGGTVSYRFREYLFISVEGKFFVYDTIQNNMTEFLFDDEKLTDASNHQGKIFYDQHFIEDGNKIYIIGSYLEKGMVITFENGNIKYKEMKLQRELKNIHKTENGYYYTAMVTNVDNLYFKNTQTGMLYLVHEYIQFGRYFEVDGELYYSCNSYEDIELYELYQLNQLEYSYKGEVIGRPIYMDQNYIIAGYHTESMRVYNNELKIISESIVTDENFNNLHRASMENDSLVFEGTEFKYYYTFTDDDYFIILGRYREQSVLDYLQYDLIIYSVIFTGVSVYVLVLKKNKYDSGEEMLVK